MVTKHTKLGLSQVLHSFLIRWKVIQIIHLPQERRNQKGVKRKRNLKTRSQRMKINQRKLKSQKIKILKRIPQKILKRSKRMKINQRKLKSQKTKILKRIQTKILKRRIKIKLKSERIPRIPRKTAMNEQAYTSLLHKIHINT